MEISIVFITFLILGLELMTMIARLIFGSAKRFWNLRKIPNIHPLFLGFILVIFYNYWYFLEIGIALIVQGLLHHFVILPLWIGESEFL